VLPEQIVGGCNEDGAEQEEGGEAELVQGVVLHAGHHGQHQEREDLHQVGGAGDEGELLDDGGLAEDSPHLGVVQ